MAKKPDCGIYCTTEPMGDSIPAGKLVFYHNHGDPGPGLYLPSDWTNNRAVFHERGNTVADEQYAQTLKALLPEGMYRVVDAFYCCDKKCRLFEQEMLVQLGYNGAAEPLLFVPELVQGAVVLPEEGTRLDQRQLTHLTLLKVHVADTSDDEQPVDPRLN